jgi:hypothetical protein
MWHWLIEFFGKVTMGIAVFKGGKEWLVVFEMRVFIWATIILRIECYTSLFLGT